MAKDISAFLDYFADPLCTMAQDGTLGRANRGFEIFTGYGGDELAESTFSLDRIVYKRDFRNLHNRLSHMDKDQYLRDEVRLLTKDRNVKEAEVTIRKLGGHYLCTFRDIGSQKELERELRRKIAQEQEKVVETARGILRVEQLLGKLRFFPAFFQELSRCASPAEFLEKAVVLMCHRNGFNYASAAVFLIEGEYLKLAFSNREHALRKFHLKKQHKFARVARSEIKIGPDERGEYVVPLTFRDKISGILHAVLEESELVVADESLKQAYRDLLESIAGYLGMMLKYLQIGEQPPEDSITGAYNRAGFVHALEDLSRRERPPVLVLIEHDQPQLTFSPEGNERLRDSAREITHYLPENAVLGRLGDDRFGIITCHDSLSEAAAWTDQVHRKLCQKWKDSPPRLAAGLAMLEKRDIPSLWERVFLCLKAAKASGCESIFYWQKAPCAFKRRGASKLV